MSAHTYETSKSVGAHYYVHVLYSDRLCETCSAYKSMLGAILLFGQCKVKTFASVCRGNQSFKQSLCSIDVPSIDPDSDKISTHGSGEEAFKFGD